MDDGVPNSSESDHKYLILFVFIGLWIIRKKSGCRAGRYHRAASKCCDYVTLENKMIKLLIKYG
jgi:hypothetical protein